MLVKLVGFFMFCSSLRQLLTLMENCLSSWAGNLLTPCPGLMAVARAGCVNKRCTGQNIMGFTRNEQEERLNCLPSNTTGLGFFLLIVDL